MQNIFRSKPPRHLTLSQINRLSSQSNITPNEVERWYAQFLRCYTSGYVSLNEFQKYIQQVYIHQGYHNEQISKNLIKELFSTLDFNHDNELNFEEFFRFTLLINIGSIDEKFKFILTLYHQKREQYFTKDEIFRLMISMLKLFDMYKLTEQLSEKIDETCKIINVKQRICWNTFCATILNQSNLFELFLSDQLPKKSPVQI